MNEEDKLEKIEEIALLLDFYRELLSEKQREFSKLYYEENLSLGEIANSFGISRQSVYDSIKKAENTLWDYEKKLQLLSDYKKNQTRIEKLCEKIEKLKLSYMYDEKLCKEFAEIKEQLLNFEEEG